jgi:hypothetical protein
MGYVKGPKRGRGVLSGMIKQLQVDEIKSLLISFAPSPS